MKIEGEAGFIIAFGKNLVKLRESQGITQEQLAHKCELNVSHLRKIEKAEINTSIGNIFKIATILKIEPSELFNWND